MGFAIDLAHNPRKQEFVQDIQANGKELQTNLESTEYLRSAVEELGVECDGDPQENITVLQLSMVSRIWVKFWRER